LLRNDTLYSLPNNKEAVFSMWSMQSGYKEEFRNWQGTSKGVECRDVIMPESDLGNRGTELNWQLQNNGKKGIGL
jgi:hypothetical protein